MVFKRCCFFCLLSLLVIVSTIPPQFGVSAQDACSGLVPSRLEVGATVRVVYDGDGIGSELRNNPGKETSGSQFLQAVPEGTVFTLLEGPVCLDGALWWRVNLPDGSEAWSAEGDNQRYYLEPYVLGTEVMRPDAANPRLLKRSFVTYSGEVSELTALEIPQGEPTPARDLWQQPDLDAANVELADRRARCLQVLAGTPWEGVGDAGDVVVPEGEYQFVPAPDGRRIFLIRHWVLQIPTCGGAPGNYFGVSTTHILSEGRQLDLFPYGQHTPTNSRRSCMSPDVSNSAWSTDLSEIVWSPDGDTVALVARYLETGTDQRLCAYYAIFLIDIFNGGVTPVTEGRRVFWSGGGSRLYYVEFVVDSTSYTIQEEHLMVLSNGQASAINIPQIASGGAVGGAAQFVPEVFNSNGVILPANSSGTQILVCNTLSGCPETLEFDLTRNLFSSVPMEIPDNLPPRQIAQLNYVADDTRLLWLTTEGRLYIQSLRAPDIGVWVQVSLDSIASGASVEEVMLLPTGIAAVLKLNTGEYALLNTISRQVQALPDLQP